MKTFGFFFVILAIFPLSIGFADSPVFVCRAKGVSDPSILEKVQSAYSSVKNLKAKFIQHSYLSSLDTSELSSGEVWFSKPGLMRWHYAEPDLQDFVVKQDTVWLYQETDNQVLIDNFKNILLTDIPVSFLMGIGDLKRDFRLVSACTASDGLILELSQRSKKSELESFKLLVDPKTYQPVGALVIDVSGNKTSIILSQLDLNSEISKDTFATNFKAGVDIVDRRKDNLG